MAEITKHGPGDFFTNMKDFAKMKIGDSIYATKAEFMHKMQGKDIVFQLPPENGDYAGPSSGTMHFSYIAEYTEYIGSGKNIYTASVAVSTYGYSRSKHRLVNCYYGHCGDEICRACHRHDKDKMIELDRRCADYSQMLSIGLRDIEFTGRFELIAQMKRKDIEASHVAPIPEVIDAAEMPVLIDVIDRPLCNIVKNDIALGMLKALASAPDLVKAQNVVEIIPTSSGITEMAKITEGEPIQQAAESVKPDDSEPVVANGKIRTLMDRIRHTLKTARRDKI
ncbi:MAG: hypothetical protein Faunusvirus14_8 [Faunusvirus sp.]|jgi:hypothetical protein|uniref:Uncharacterized protein n=1 Tax=Faunusvirus sp. TaxID=2487766 RepID=A0A3G4ZZK4_9VIRU|nr:MAG: hypothetical protein Faunusvirus14_8 [Faunusvirus sp.]